MISFIIFAPENNNKTFKDMKSDRLNSEVAVIIGDYTDEAVESMFGAFLSSLDRGIYVNGDFVPIEVEGADWVDKDDSILKAQVAVQIKIRFDGGVYRDTDFAKVSDVAVESITKNEGKEFIDGE